MGNASALKAWQVLANSERALAIELLAGAQAVEFLAPLSLDPACARRTTSCGLVAAARRRPVSRRRTSRRWRVQSGRDELVAAVEAEIGELA